MKNKTILLSTLLVALFSITLISGCKKEEDDNNTVADGYVGIWNMQDSIFYNSVFYSSTTYNFTIAKKDASSVYMYNFNGVDTTIWSVSETAMAYVSGASGSSASVLSSSGITRSSNKIYFLVDLGSGDAKRGTATKQ